MPSNPAGCDLIQTGKYARSILTVTVSGVSVAAVLQQKREVKALH
jgi:hypothetical protein